MVFTYSYSKTIGRFRRYLKCPKAFIFSFFLLLININLAYSQPEGADAADPEAENPSNYKFYPHDYARSPLNQDKNALPANTSAGKDQKVKTNNSGVNKDISVETSGNLKELKGKKIESASILVNGLDNLQLEKGFSSLIDLFNQKSIRPATVSIIGQSFQDFTANANNYIKRLALLGVNVDVANNVPAKFPVTKLPSWILTTTDGDILLEGIQTPIKFINSKGEFIDPKEVVGGELDNG